MDGLMQRTGTGEGLQDNEQCQAKHGHNPAGAPVLQGKPCCRHSHWLQFTNRIQPTLRQALCLPLLQIVCNYPKREREGNLFFICLGPWVKNHPGRFKLKDVSVLMGHEVTVSGTRAVLRTEQGDPEVEAAHILGEEEQNRQQ